MVEISCVLTDAAKSPGCGVMRYFADLLRAKTRSRRSSSIQMAANSFGKAVPLTPKTLPDELVIERLELAYQGAIRVPGDLGEEGCPEIVTLFFAHFSSLPSLSGNFSR
jgi:hypothetical protein